MLQIVPAMKKWSLLFFLAVLAFACKRNPLKVDVSHIDVTVRIDRFEQRLFGHPPDSVVAAVPALQREYGLFFKRFLQLINVGHPGTIVFHQYFKLFLSDDMNREVYRKVQEVYPDLHPLEKKLTGAFKHYKYYFPQRQVPQVYSYISGFNASLLVDEGILGIGLDRYLGKDIVWYDRLGIPKYMQRKMVPEKIPTDCMVALAMTEFPFMPAGSDTAVTENVINRMIWEGKLLYFVQAMMPKEKEELITGFTPEQLKWCRDNEKIMWAYLIEHKLLFKTDYMTINKLTKDAPFTSYFPRESPGKAANWIGWQIVKKYMKRHPEVTLPQLMGEIRYQKILDASAYDPQ